MEDPKKKRWGRHYSSDELRHARHTVIVRLPVVGRETLTVDVSRGTPYVPITLRIVLGRLGSLEPFVLYRIPSHPKRSISSPSVSQGPKV